MVDRKQSLEVYRSWAEKAWCEECSSNPEQSIPKAYAAGFKDGFVDFVFAGGSGEPPPVPPRQFWNVDVRNPHGRSQATDWFAGYRHGSQVARDEGHRERTLVSSSLLLFSPESGCWEDEPNDVDPLADVAVEPSQPEIILPGQLVPETSAGNIEPELPILATPDAEEAPIVEMPSITVPEVESMPAAEELPRPEQLPTEEDFFQPSAPAERLPKEVEPPADVEDIFGLPEHRRGSSLQKVQYLAGERKFVRRDIADYQDRTKYASHTLRRMTSVKDTNTTAELSIIRTQGKSTASPVARAVTVPTFNSSAEQMLLRIAR